MTSTNNAGWRLVHNGISVLSFEYYESGYTESNNTILEFDTQSAGLLEIARLGLIYNGEKLEFVSGMTKLEFRNRLTFNEKVALDNYEMTIDAMAIDAQIKIQRKAIIKTVIKDFDSATYIDLKDPATIQAIQLFASFGLIEPDRVNEILGVV